MPPVASSVPLYRHLRVYAFDPFTGTRPETATMNSLTIPVCWESSQVPGRCDVQPGPIGEYLEVIDYDPASKCWYDPVNLNNPYILAQDGVDPAEGDPHFHQQMVYAVAMNTIRNFEQALGRDAQWAPQTWKTKQGTWKTEYVRRLRIYPHALRAENAFYSPEKKALLFGYFPASDAAPGTYFPGGMVFTCLSHDIIAHETSHALLDGMHTRFRRASNPDVLAFHEAFADIVAMLQHFTFPEVLRHQIAKTRGDLTKPNMLGELAQEFGWATGRAGALRSAVGTIDPTTKQWRPSQPDPLALERVEECHERGAILVAALFDAFLTIYTQRSADLLRIASGGTGVLPAGDLHPDLVNRLAAEAAKAAQHLLHMCLRALDYCPPLDITFGEYLRALITADYDLVRDDDRHYRVAIIDAFRERGIYPRDIRTLSEDSLRWQAPEVKTIQFPASFLHSLRDTIRSWRISGDRHRAFKDMEHCRADIHQQLKQQSRHFTPEQEEALGLDFNGVRWAKQAVQGSRPGKFEVHSLRPAHRVGPEGNQINEFILEITQSSHLADTDTLFRGGCTLILDMDSGKIRYCIRKDICSATRLDRQQTFQQGWYYQALSAVSRQCYGQNWAVEPFALLHSKVLQEVLA